MPTQTTIVNCETGEAEVRDMTPAEEAAFLAYRAEAATERTAEDARATKLSGARPNAALLVKLRDNVALTAPELQTVVRYLALHTLREARG